MPLLKNISRFKKTQTGAVGVELALVFPIFMFVLFAIIEYGVALYNKSVMTNVSREVAREGIVYRLPRFNNDALKQKAQEKCNGMVISFGSSFCTAIVSGASGAGGTDLKVDLSYDYKGFFAYKSQSPIVASTLMLNE